MRFSTKHLVPAMAAGALALALTASASAAPSGRPQPDNSLAGMKILMSNDDSMQNARPDGSDGRGLYEVRRALCAAGADVVVMAPWQFMSGAGTGMTGGGALTVSQRTAMPAGFENDCKDAPSKGVVFGVCKGAAPCGPTTPSATPGDTVRLALRGGLAAKVGWTDGPDLVVTGANSGPNIGNVTYESGTLSAAIMAIENGKPAIALSSGFDYATMSITQRTYREFADFVPGFVGDLEKRGLLKPEYAINVNYPNAVEGKTPKPVWTEIGTSTVLPVQYKPTGDTFAIGIGDCDEPGTFCREEEKRKADWAELDKGNITVSTATGDRSYTGHEDLRLELFLKTGR